MAEGYIPLPVRQGAGTPTSGGAEPGPRPAPSGPTPGGGKAPLPSMIRFEITEHCSMDCPHCYIPTKVRHTAGMGLSLARVKSVLDHIATPNQRLLILGGEPFEREDAVEIITYAKSKGAIVGVDTNAWHLDPEKIRALGEAGLDKLNISIYGTTAAPHDAFTCPGAFEKICEVIEQAHEVGLKVDLAFALTKQNFGELFKVRGFARGVDAKDVHLDIYLSRGHAAQDRFLELTTPQFFLFWGILRPFLGRFLSPKELPNAKMKVSYCEKYAVPLVKPDGEVWPCLFYPRRFANILTEGAEAVWEKFHRYHYDPAICSQCVKNKCVTPVRDLLDKIPQERVIQLHGLYNRFMKSLD